MRGKNYLVVMSKLLVIGITVEELTQKQKFGMGVKEVIDRLKGMLQAARE